MTGAPTLTELSPAEIGELESMLADLVKSGDGGAGRLPIVLDAAPRHGSHTNEALAAGTTGTAGR